MKNDRTDNNNNNNKNKRAFEIYIYVQNIIIIIIIIIINSYFRWFNLLVGNPYYPPNSDVKVIENYFNSLETNLNLQNFRVVL
jgi:hypothetical protein